MFMNTFFSVSIIWSFILIAFDLIMVRKKLYYKYLKKGSRLSSQQCYKISYIIDIIFVVLIMVFIRIICYACINAEEFLGYIFGSLAVTTSTWLILAHILRTLTEQNNNKGHKV